MALLTALLSGLPLAASQLSLPTTNLYARDNSSLVSCLTSANLNPVTPSSSDYSTDAQAYNERLPYKPSALVYPKSSQEVSAAVKCAASSGVSVNARSGGHSYAAFGLGGEDGHLIVSLDNLDKIQVNSGNNTVAIGAGNRLGDVALGLWEQGERAMAHGTCPYVGIGGHAGHGGFGLPSRGWGLVADQTYEVEAVLADGSIVTANNATNPDLFWGVRGAASSLAIVTEFRAITHSAPKHSIWFTYSWTNLTVPQASDFYQKWQTFAATLESGYGFQIHINPQTNTTPAFIVDGYLYSDDDDAEAQVNATMATLLTSYAIPPDSSQVADQTWIYQLEFLGGVDAPSKLNTSTGPDTDVAFFATSIFIPEATPLTSKATDAFIEYLWTNASAANDAGVAWYIIADLYGGDASVIKQAGQDYNAFDGRDSLYSWQFWGQAPSGAPPIPAATIPTIEGMRTTIINAQPETKFKGYFNYVDSTLSREEAWAYYWPDHTDKLRQIKSSVDPKNLFNFPQSFTPAGSSSTSGSKRGRGGRHHF